MLQCAEKGTGKKRGRIWLPAAVCLLALWLVRGVWISYHDPVVNRWQVPLECLTAQVRAVVLSAGMAQ